MATLASIADFGGLDSLRERIDVLWARREQLDDRDPAVQAAVLSVIELLDRGTCESPSSTATARSSCTSGSSARS